MQAPELPDLEPVELSTGTGRAELELDGALVAAAGGLRLEATRVVVTESELRGVTLDAPRARGLRLRDVVLRDCDLSNVDGREGALTRVEIQGSRLVGFGLAGGQVSDLRVVDSTLALGSFASGRLRNVTFERVILREASFAQAGLERVEFVDCQLEGADFRGARLKECAIRGSGIEGIVGIDSLRGLTMPLADVLASAVALAAAVGIEIEAS